MFQKLSISNAMNQFGRYLVGEPIQMRREPMLKVKPVAEGTGKSQPEVKEEPAGIVTVIKKEAATETSTIDLQEAVIWSEILGKPMCKRRNERMGVSYGYQGYPGGR